MPRKQHILFRIAPPYPTPNEGEKGGWVEICVWIRSWVPHFSSERRLSRGKAPHYINIQKLF